MANPAKDMILFPSGGMSAEDIGDSQVQKPALEAVSNYGNKEADGTQKGPEGDCCGMFGSGPEVIQNKGDSKDSNPCPGMGSGY